jgi:hypothetical protein
MIDPHFRDRRLVQDGAIKPFGLHEIAALARGRGLGIELMDIHHGFPTRAR